MHSHHFSLFKHYALLKHDLFPSRQAILNPLHHHTQILLAVHEVQIVTADGQHQAVVDHNPAV